MHVAMLGGNFHLNIQLNVAKAHFWSAQGISAPPQTDQQKAKDLQG